MIRNPPCQTCGGTGQISFFKGVSRFLLSCEECPECAGLGFQFDQPPDNQAADRDSPPPERRITRSEATGGKSGPGR